MNVIWHEVECGAYAADLRLWEDLASQCAGPILDLGCGTGRVAFHVAKRNHRVRGLDVNASLVAAFNERRCDLPAEAEVGDVRAFELQAKFGLVLAPMQLVQLLASADERIASLSCIASHLQLGGLAASAIVEEMSSAIRAPSPPLPDVREVDGWVYSSLPLSAEQTDEEIVVRRLRQTVSPQGNLSDEVDEIRLRALTAAELEHEAEAAGLRPAGRRAIPATDAHVGSTVVLLERSA